MLIFLQKKITENSNLTTEGLAVYVVLRKIMNDEERLYYVSNNMIAYTLTGQAKYEKCLYTKIKSGIDNLKDLGFIKINKSIGSTDYIMDLSDIYFDGNRDKVIENKDYFIKIYLDEVHSIMNGDKNRFNLLKYFIFLIGTISNQKFVFTDATMSKTIQSFIGEQTIEHQIKLSGIPKNTIIDYCKYLEELQLIYVYRHEDFVLMDGKIKNLHNGYGRYCDKKYIAKYCEQYADKKESYKCNKNVNKRKANEKNSFLQKYNNMAKGGKKKYDNDEILKIYQFILEYNQKIEKDIELYKKDTSNTKEYNEMQIDKLKVKIKRLSVFDKYDFLKKDIRPVKELDIDDNMPWDGEFEGIVSF